MGHPKTLVGLRTHTNQELHNLQCLNEEHAERAMRLMAGRDWTRGMAFVPDEGILTMVDCTWWKPGHMQRGFLRDGPFDIAGLNLGYAVRQPRDIIRGHATAKQVDGE